MSGSERMPLNLAERKNRSRTDKRSQHGGSSSAMQRHKRRRKGTECNTHRTKQQYADNESRTYNDLLVIGEGCKHTVTIAVGGSVLQLAQSKELATLLAGQIARAAAIFKIDEIVLFDDTGTSRTQHGEVTNYEESTNYCSCVFMERVLLYTECPQYLRKYLVPYHNDLSYACLLNPLKIAHHMTKNDVCRFREGVITKKLLAKRALVDVGLKNKAIFKNKHEVDEGVRVTVEFYNEGVPNNETELSGAIVSRRKPVKNGLYWGFQTRIAHSLGAVFSESPFKDGYDVIIGTSDRGTSIDDFVMPFFRHLIILFGGPDGLELSFQADQTLHTKQPKDLFHYYLNTCPDQGCVSIRTEEAIMISLAMLRSKIAVAMGK